MIGATLRAGALVALVTLGACATNKPAAPTPPVQPEPPPPVRPQETPAATRSEIRTELAAGYYERGQMAVAIEEVNEALRLDPNNARAYNVLGLVYTTLGDTAKAEQSFRQALTLAPQDSEIHHNWGWYLCSHGRARESIAEFETAIRNPLYKTPETALVNAGRCSASLGDTAAAEAYFKRAFTTSPNNPEASYGLALLAYRAKRFDEARAWMRPVMLQANPAAEALYLGMCIEQKLGDRQAELSYVSQLRNRHPDSAEAKALATAACD
jgi:type IV pilus assembly protein PilF